MTQRVAGGDGVADADKPEDAVAESGDGSGVAVAATLELFIALAFWDEEAPADMVTVASELAVADASTLKLAVTAALELADAPLLKLAVAAALADAGGGTLCDAVVSRDRVAETLEEVDGVTDSVSGTTTLLDETLPLARRDELLDDDADADVSGTAGDELADAEQEGLLDTEELTLAEPTAARDALTDGLTVNVGELGAIE